MYTVCEKLGEGAFGIVHRAVHNELGPIAIKRIRLDHEGIPPTTLREIAVLKTIDHPNILKILGVHEFDALTLDIAFELCDCDLKHELQHNRLQPTDIRRYFGQLMLGISWCHSANILHRDIKPHNLLLDKSKRVLKIGDFGLTRHACQSIGRAARYTSEVVTRWYRCPELLLGIDVYHGGLDIWSCGCVLGEMCDAEPLFPGDSQIDTLFHIFRLLGTPTSGKMVGLDHFNVDFPKWKGQDMSMFGRLGASGVDLLRCMLDYDPATRITAEESLRHAYLEPSNAGTGSRKEGGVASPARDVPRPV